MVALFPLYVELLMKVDILNLQGWLLNIIWMKRNKSKWKDCCDSFSLKSNVITEKRQK